MTRPVWHGGNNISKWRASTTWRVGVAAIMVVARVMRNVMIYAAIGAAHWRCGMTSSNIGKYSGEIDSDDKRRAVLLILSMRPFFGDNGGATSVANAFSATEPRLFQGVARRRMTIGAHWPKIPYLRHRRRGIFIGSVPIRRAVAACSTEDISMLHSWRFNSGSAERKCGSRNNQRASSTLNRHAVRRRVKLCAWHGGIVL